MSLVFRAPEGPVAREARRPHFVRRRASKPARALRTLRRPPHQWGLVCRRVFRIVSMPGQAPPPPTGTAAVPCVDGLPCLPGTQAPATVVGRAPADSASVRGYEVFNQSPSPSIGVSVPHGDVNCSIPVHHRKTVTHAVRSVGVSVAKPAVDLPLIWRSR